MDKVKLTNRTELVNTNVGRAIAAIFLAGIIGGTGGVFIKYMDIPASAIAWLRTSIPAIIIFLWMWQKKIAFFRGNYKRMLLASALNSFRLYLFIVAFIFTSIGNAIILFYTYPVFVVLIEYLVYKEKLVKRQLVLMLTAFLGLIIAYLNSEFSFESRDFIGMSAALASALIYAFVVNLFKTESKNYHSFELVFYQNLTGVLIFLPFFLLALPEVDSQNMIIGSSYGIIIGIGVFGLFFYGLKYVKASKASAIMYMEVVSAILLNYFVMKEAMSWNMWLGGGIIVLSSFLISRIK